MTDWAERKRNERLLEEAYARMSMLLQRAREATPNPGQEVHTLRPDQLPRQDHGASPYGEWLK